MKVENNNISGHNNDPEQIDLIDLLVQLWRGKMTIIASIIVAIVLAIGYRSSERAMDVNSHCHST